MNQAVEFECKCSFKTKASFKKPHVIQPSLATIECVECKSKWLIRVSVARDPKTKLVVPGSVLTQSKIVWASPVLEALLKEEAEFNAE